MMVSVGIDVSKDQLAVAVQRGDGRLDQAEFANDRGGWRKLDHFLDKRQAKTGQVCLEATGSYGEGVAEFLYARGYAVSVVNPARIKAYAASQLRRNKTDQLDAALIADFCASQTPPLWTPPDPAWRELRALVRHLSDLEDDLQRQRNRLHALEHSAHRSAQVEADLKAQMALLEQQLEQVKALLQEHIDQHPDLRRQRDLLVTIKGVGPLTAAKLLAEFRALADFDDVRQVVAFAGLNPPPAPVGQFGAWACRYFQNRIGLAARRAVYARRLRQDPQSALAGLCRALGRTRRLQNANRGGCDA